MWRFVIFFLLLNLIANICKALPSTTASMRTGGYSPSVGGGSLRDTYWIDLMTIPEIANTDPELSELKKIYDATEMGFKIEQSRHITVFMPNNAAIKKQLAGALPNLDYPFLIEVFQGHILPEVIKASELPFGKRTYTTEGGTEIVMDIQPNPAPPTTNIGSKAYQSRNRVEIIVKGVSDPAIIQGREIDNANGIAYILDKVLLSPEQKKKVEQASTKDRTSVDTSDITAPGHIEETNFHHWFYGRYGGTPQYMQEETGIPPPQPPPTRTSSRAPYFDPDGYNNTVQIHRSSNIKARVGVLSR